MNLRREATRNSESKRVANVVRLAEMKRSSKQFPEKRRQRTDGGGRTSTPETQTTDIGQTTAISSQSAAASSTIVEPSTSSTNEQITAALANIQEMVTTMVAKQADINRRFAAVEARLDALDAVQLSARTSFSIPSWQQCIGVPTYNTRGSPQSFSSARPAINGMDLRKSLPIMANFDKGIGTIVDSQVNQTSNKSHLESPAVNQENTKSLKRKADDPAIGSKKRRNHILRPLSLVASDVSQARTEEDVQLLMELDQYQQEHLPAVSGVSPVNEPARPLINPQYEYGSSFGNETTGRHKDHVNVIASGSDSGVDGCMFAATARPRDVERKTAGVHDITPLPESFKCDCKKACTARCTCRKSKSGCSDACPCISSSRCTNPLNNLAWLFGDGHGSLRPTPCFAHWLSKRKGRITDIKLEVLARTVLDVKKGGLDDLPKISNSGSNECSSKSWTNDQRQAWDNGEDDEDMGDIIGDAYRTKWKKTWAGRETFNVEQRKEHIEALLRHSLSKGSEESSTMWYYSLCREAWVQENCTRHCRMCDLCIDGEEWQWETAGEDWHCKTEGEVELWLSMKRKRQIQDVDEGKI